MPDYITAELPLPVWNLQRLEADLTLFEAELALRPGAAINVTLPVASMISNCTSGAIGDISLNLGWPDLQSNNGQFLAQLYGAGNVNLTLPFPIELSSAVKVGKVMHINLVLPIIDTLFDSSMFGNIGSIDADLPTPTFAGVWHPHIIGNIAGAIPLPRWSLTGTTGGIGSIDATVPLLEYAGIMWANGVGTIDVTLPVFTIDQDGTSTPSTLSYKAIVLNMKNFGVSEYPDYSFNSIAEFRGQRFGASGTKIYKLGAQLDATEDINMTIGTGNLDMTRPVLMLPRDMWLTLRSGKTVRVRVLENEKSDDFIYEYESEDFVENLRNTRVKLGRGLSGQSLMFEVDNIDGENIDIERIHLKSAVLHRKKR
jgi:hypothetical protein